MTRIIVLGGSALFWGVMMLALVRREVLPYFEYQAPPSYKSFLRGVREPELTVAEIFAATQPVGTLETLAMPLGDGTWRIRTQLKMKARLPKAANNAGDQFDVGIKSESHVDALFRLTRTRSDIQLAFAQVSLRAERRQEMLVATFEFKVGGQRIAGGTQNIEFPPDGMIGDLFQPFPGGGPLHVGKKWKIPTISPDLTGFRVTSLYAAVTEHEPLVWNGEKVDTLRVEIRTEPTEEKRPKYVVLCREDGLALSQQITFENLLYEIVLKSRKTITRPEAYRWNAMYDGPP